MLTLYTNVGIKAKTFENPSAGVFTHFVRQGGGDKVRGVYVYLYAPVPNLTLSPTFMLTLGWY